MTAKTVKPFGLWKSPITVNEIASGLRFNDVQFDSSGNTLVWLEGRSDFGMLVAKREQDAPYDLNPEISCRGGVGYGGGEFCVWKNQVVFAGKDNRLYHRHLSASQPVPITPSFGGAASPRISPNGSHVLYVFSDGTQDAIAIVDIAGKQWPQKLIEGADFYMQPVWHPGGEKIAWVEWNHPNMPWDGTRLKMANLTVAAQLEAGSVLDIAGDDTTVIFQPEFSPDGKWLSYITSAGNWDAMVLVDLGSMEKQVIIQSEGAHLMEPGWIQGIRNYVWANDSQSIYLVHNGFGTNSLWFYDIGSRTLTKSDTEQYSWIDQITISSENKLAFIATSPAIPPRVVVYDQKSFKTIARSSSESIPAEFLPKPEMITWKTEQGVDCHGIYYPPTNPNYHSSGLPPVILSIHGGPTSQATIGYRTATAYFTSRGYGWLDVNYRGSTGYGHAYRKMLEQRWGDVDVEDAVGAARALVSNGLANEKQLVIMGGSAGGYTVLNSLIRYPGVFKAGICNYGVADLFKLDLDTHKFESHYTASMVGTLPEASQRYHDWSPVFHAHLIRDPLAVFQGAEDKVVLPNQSEAIIEKVRHNGIPYLYQLYQGEGHGFRKKETLLDYYNQVENFLIENVLFAV